MVAWLPHTGEEVVVFPNTSRQALGRVIDDFGEGPGYAVDIGDRTVDPARRWAVLTDDGGLVFVDTVDLARVLHD